MNDFFFFLLLKSKSKTTNRNLENDIVGYLVAFGHVQLLQTSTSLQELLEMLRLQKKREGVIRFAIFILNTIE